MSFFKTAIVYRCENCPNPKTISKLSSFDYVKRSVAQLVVFCLCVIFQSAENNFCPHALYDFFCYLFARKSRSHKVSEMFGHFLLKKQNKKG